MMNALDENFGQASINNEYKINHSPFSTLFVCLIFSSYRPDTNVVFSYGYNLVYETKCF